MKILFDSSNKNQTTSTTTTTATATTTTTDRGTNTEDSSLCDTTIASHVDETALSSREAMAVEALFDLNDSEQRRRQQHQQLQLTMTANLTDMLGPRKRRKNDWSAYLKKARFDAENQTAGAAAVAPVTAVASLSARASKKTKKVRFDNVIVREHGLTLGGHVYRRSPPPADTADDNDNGTTAAATHPFPLEQLMFGLALDWEIVSETEYSLSDFETHHRRGYRRRIKDPEDRFDMLVKAGLDPLDICDRESKRLSIPTDEVMELFFHYLVPFSDTATPATSDPYYDHDESDDADADADVDVDVDESCLHDVTKASTAIHPIDHNFDYFDIPEDYDVCF